MISNLQEILDAKDILDKVKQELDVERIPYSKNIEVGIMIEVPSAGDKRMIPLLLGMGLDELSMSPISILPVRELINSLSYKEMKKLSEDVLQMSTSEEIEKYINEFLKSTNKSI